MRRIGLATILVILPLAFGGLIYIALRTTDITMFRWFENLGFENGIINIRNQIEWKTLPDWVKYNLPDLVWVFSFTSALLLSSSKKINSQNLLLISIPTLLGIASELGQFLHLIPGTFDKIDVLFYLLGGIVAFRIISLFKKVESYSLNNHFFTNSMIMIFFIFVAFGSAEEKDNSLIKLNLAYNYAQGTVQKELDFPDDSEFPNEYEVAEHVIELSSDEFLIDSWVDSISNSGDIIRRNFSCKVRLVENNAIVENLVFYK